jgi:hypothetical protein
MPWLTVNGISVAPIVAAGSAPKGPRRDIGEQAAAASGALRLTRQARKHDLEFETVPLAGADARAWEGLFAGEGHVWSFDSHVYSSKGLGPSTLGVAAVSAAQKKYGAKSLLISYNNTNTIFTGVWPSGSTATLMFWYALESAAFSHYVIRSDGAKWVNGVRNDAASTSFISLTATGFDLDGSEFEGRFWDDLVALPFLVPTDWPAQVYAAGAAFGSLPTLACAGDVVREGASRSMLGTANEAAMLMGGMAGSFQRDLRRLSVELKEV